MGEVASIALPIVGAGAGFFAGGPAGAMTGFQAGSALSGGVSGFSQGKQQEKALKQQARAERISAETQQLDQQDILAQTLGSNAAMLASRGIDPRSAGSAGFLFDDNVVRGRRNQRQMQLESESRQAQLLGEASNARRQGLNSLLSGFISAGAAVHGGMQQQASLGQVPFKSTGLSGAQQQFGTRLHGGGR